MPAGYSTASLQVLPVVSVLTNLLPHCLFGPVSDALPCMGYRQLEVGTGEQVFNYSS